MTNGRPSKTFVVAAVALAVTTGLVASAFLAFPFGGQKVDAANEANTDSSFISLEVLEPATYSRDTGRSSVLVDFDGEPVEIKRGSSATVEMVAKHLGGAEADQSVNVRILPPIGYTLYPPSVAESTTAEERFESAKSGRVLAGAIDLGELVTIVGADEKAVEKSGQQTFSVMISIPEDYPDELLGEEFIPINAEATDSNGNPIPAQGTGITIVVTE